MPNKEEVAAVMAGMRLLESGDEEVVVTRREFLNDMGTIARAKDGLLTSYVSNTRFGIEYWRRQELEDIGDDERDEDESVCTEDDIEIEAECSFDVDVIEEHSIDAPSSPICVMDQESYSKGQDSNKETEVGCWGSKQGRGINFFRPRQAPLDHIKYTQLPTDCPDTESIDRSPDTEVSEELPSGSDTPKKLERQGSILQNIIDDFTPNKGDQKILRAIGRTATVNAAVLVTAATGGAAGAVGYAAGGAITSKRLIDGLAQKDEKEVTKSLAVYGCATGASIAGQALTGALMIGVAGASLPVAGAVAFGVGCCSGITAGALSEWTVDSVLDKFKKRDTNNMERCKSDGALLGRKNGHTLQVMNESKRRPSCTF